MNKFYLSRKSLLNGSFSIHKDNCPFLPEIKKRIFLGSFDSSREAVKIAKMICSKSDTCDFCLRVDSKTDRYKKYDWRIPGNLKIVYSKN